VIGLGLNSESYFEVPTCPERLAFKVVFEAHTCFWGVVVDDAGVIVGATSRASQPEVESVCIG